VTFGQLRTWVEVARQCSVQAAATALSVSGSSVSAAISALQRELDVELVAHESRGIQLTAAGEELARYGAEILGLAMEAGLAVREAGGRAATLRLVAVPAAAEYLLPQILSLFRGLQPQVQVSMEVANKAAVFEILASHRADLGIGGRPAAGHGVWGEPFLDNELLVVAAPGHPLAGLPEVEPGQLAGETWLVREGGSGTASTAERFLAENGVHPGAIMTLGSNGAVKEAAAVGLGLTLLSRRSAANKLASGSLVGIHVRGTPLRRPWYVLYLAPEPLAGSRLAFVQLLRSLEAREGVERWVSYRIASQAEPGLDS
jgi:DNA-binding transcriptional LysR family regulator